MDWARILAYVTGLVHQELLARSEYLAAENRILKAQLKGRLKLSDAERATLGEIAHRLGRKQVARIERSEIRDAGGYGIRRAVSAWLLL
jgi:putative transposase